MLNLDSSSKRRGGQDATEGVSSIFDDFRMKRRTQTPDGERKVVGELRGKNISEDYMRQMPRRWREGDLYAPHDLSEVEATKWRKMTSVQRDLVDLLGLRPLDMYAVGIPSDFPICTISRWPCRASHTISTWVDRHGFTTGCGMFT